MGEIQRSYDNLSMEMSELASSIRKFNSEIEDLNDRLSLKDEKSFDVKKCIKECLEEEKEEKERIKNILKEILIDWGFYFCFLSILFIVVCCIISS